MKIFCDALSGKFPSTSYFFKNKFELEYKL